MNIVFTIKSINLGGGSERSTTTIANALVQRGHQVTIVSFTGKDTSPFFSIDERIKRVYLAPKKDKYPVLVREIRRIILLRRLYKMINPDVIVVIGATRAWVNVPATKGYKVITKEYFSVHHRSQLTSNLSRRLTARTSEAVIALSEEDKRIYLEKFGAKRVEIIPNPLTLSNPAPTTLNNKIVLCLGRMTRVKGFDLLLKAWKQVRHQDWDLYLVGDGTMRKQLEKQVKADSMQKNVHFFPATANVLPYYQQASIFVLPSRSEAFGNVLTEAMSVGVPTVCFDCGDGVREVVANGETGIIVPPQDTQAMAAALDTLMDNPERLQAMHRQSLERVKRYNTEAIMEQWETLCKQIMND